MYLFIQVHFLLKIIKENINKYLKHLCLKIKNQHFIKISQTNIKMPNLKIEQDRFDELMGKKYTFDQLDELGF